ncbi:B12-binding domain-containing protein [Planctomycetota bacterium]
MISEATLERYMDALLKGDRKQSRSVIEETLQIGTPANMVYVQIIWPVMVEIEKLVKLDRITTSQEHLATRINRTIVDQLQNKLPRKESKGKKIAVCCAQDEIQELGAQIMADLFESDGWEVRFLGGGLNNDDVLAFTHEYCPDVLLIYGSTAKQAPKIRELIDIIKEVNADPDLLIMVSGGLFNRAKGLWEEIGADLFAASAEQAVQVAANGKMPETKEPSPPRRKKKRQKVSQKQ